MLTFGIFNTGVDGDACDCTWAVLKTTQQSLHWNWKSVLGKLPCCTSVLNLSVLCLAFHFQPSTQSNYTLPPLCDCSLTLVTVMKQWPDSQTSVWFVRHHLLSWNGGKTDLCAKQALQWKVRPQCKTSTEVKHADITHTHWLFQTALFTSLGHCLAQICSSASSATSRAEKTNFHSLKSMLLHV